MPSRGFRGEAGKKAVCPLLHGDEVPQAGTPAANKRFEFTKRRFSTLLHRTGRSFVLRPRRPQLYLRERRRHAAQNTEQREQRRGEVGETPARTHRRSWSS